MPEFGHHHIPGMLLMNTFNIKPKDLQEPRQLTEIITSEPTNINIIVSRQLHNRSISFSENLKSLSLSDGYEPLHLTHRKKDRQDPTFIKYDIKYKNRRTILVNEFASLEFVDDLCSMMLKDRDFVGNINIFVDGKSGNNEIWRSCSSRDCNMYQKIVSGRLEMYLLSFTPSDVIANLGELER